MTEWPYSGGFRGVLIEHLQRQFVEISGERDTALAERDTALAERDTALAERDTALAERDTALAERDTALAERDQIVRSRSWRSTAVVRQVASRARSIGSE